LLLDFLDALLEGLQDFVSLLLESLGHFTLLFVNVFEDLFMRLMNLLNVATAVALHDFLVLPLQLFKFLYFFSLLLIVNIDALKQVLVVTFWLNDV
jgi:hypothetical protein